MNQIQNIQDLKLNQEEIFILSTNNYRSCPQNPDNWIVSLSTNPNSTQFLQCAQCFSENPNQQTLNLVGLIKENEKTVFKNYPVHGKEQLYQKLKQIFNADCSVDGLQSKITSFFLNLRKSIEQKINLKEEQMMSQAKSLWSFNEQVIIQYNKFAEKEQLKNIITDFKDDFKKQNELFKEIFTRISTNQNKYQEELNKKINFFETQKSMINFETPENINQNILQLIDSNDMFLIKNFEDLKINNKNEKYEFYVNNIQKIDKSELTTSQLIAKLISNKLNRCSKELVKELQQIVFTLSNSIDRVNVKSFLNEDLLELDFDKMEDQQINLIKELSRYYITVIIQFNNLFASYLQQFLTLKNTKKIKIKRADKNNKKLNIQIYLFSCIKLFYIIFVVVTGFETYLLNWIFLTPFLLILFDFKQILNVDNKDQKNSKTKEDKNEMNNIYNLKYYEKDFLKIGNIQNK